MYNKIRGFAEITR